MLSSFCILVTEHDRGLVAIVFILVPGNAHYLGVRIDPVSRKRVGIGSKAHYELAEEYNIFGKPHGMHHSSDESHCSHNGQAAAPCEPFDQ